MRRLAVLLVLSLTIAVDAGLAWAHDGSSSTATTSAAPELTRGIAGLTSRLLDLQTKHERAADLDGKRTALRDLVAVAAARQQRLAALAQDHPAEVIRAALSAKTRATLPPEVAKYVEEDVTLEGELDVLHEDYADGGRYVHWLKLPTGRLSMSFAGTKPDLATGDRVRVRALRVLHALAVGGGSQVSVVAAAPAYNTFGAQKTAVILISFSNQPGVSSTTAAQAHDVMFGAGASASNFFLEVSYQQTWLTGDVMGPFTIPISSTSGCDPFGIATAAEQAALAAGHNLSTYTRRVYAFPSNGCGWWGLGTIGGSPSMSWINGSFQTGVVAHEMGHNLGLYHSHALECGSVTLASSCSSVEYGDVLDTMGSAIPPKHYNAAQKDRLGWLNYGSSPPITTVQTSGAYAIEPYESMGTNPKAIKVRSSAGDWYYVELRQAIGFDASYVSNNPNVKNGVVVHLMDGGAANGIYLLDMTPATSAWSDPALGVGQTFVDAAGGITITPQWVSTSGAGVEITIGPVACTRQSPTVAISPANQQGAPGASMTYTVSVTNRDFGCGTSSFQPSASVPAGWIGNFGAAGLSIASGATSSTTLTVQSPPTVLAAAYTVGATVRNVEAASYAGGASATYTVTGPACTRRNPTVTVSPAAQQGAPGATVSYTVSVANNDTGCAAASFSQTATVPPGWTASFGAASLSIAPGATKTTSLNVKASATAAMGSYTIVPRSRNTAATAYEGVSSATYTIPAACVRKAPTVKVSPANQQGTPGAQLAYAVSVTNNDTNCAAATFSNNATAPSGWTATFVNGAVSLTPGATGAVTMNVKAPTTAKAGSYTIVPKSSHPAVAGLTSTATATYAVTGSGDGGTGGAVTVTDQFTRGDSDTIGNGWSEVSGELAIAANELRSSDALGLHIAVLSGTAGSKQTVAASFASTDNNVSPRFGVIARYRDPNNYYMCYRVVGGTSVLRIAKVVNGVEVVLKSASIGNPIRGTMFSISCRAEGTTIELAVGTVKVTVVDATFSSGNVGLFMRSGSQTAGKGASHRADGFTATVQ